MNFHPSALKHGMGAEDAAHAAHWAQWVEPLSALSGAEHTQLP